MKLSRKFLIFSILLVSALSIYILHKIKNPKINISLLKKETSYNTVILKYGKPDIKSEKVLDSGNSYILIIYFVNQNESFQLIFDNNKALESMYHIEKGIIKEVHLSI